MTPERDIDSSLRTRGDAPTAANVARSPRPSSLDSAVAMAEPSELGDLDPVVGGEDLRRAPGIGKQPGAYRQRGEDLPRRRCVGGGAGDC